jgi:hypothetical protein
MARQQNIEMKSKQIAIKNTNLQNQAYYNNQTGQGASGNMTSTSEQRKQDCVSVKYLPKQQMNYTSYESGFGVASGNNSVQNSGGLGKS